VAKHKSPPASNAATFWKAADLIDHIRVTGANADGR